MRRDGLPARERPHTITLKDDQPGTLSPEWLRKVAADPKAVILIAEPKLSMLADAIEIADESAQCVIESETHAVDVGAFEWCDLASIESPFAETIEQSIQYLDARGILIRHPELRNLVRFQGLAE